MRNYSYFILVTLLFITSSCFKSKDSSYLMFEEPYVRPYIEPIEEDSRIYPLESFLDIAKIDILFVVDNSGSMQSIQDNVAKNSGTFMREFALNSSIDWKMGVVSTDMNEDPYLGFQTSFDSSLIIKNDPVTFGRVVEKFSSSIDSLGTSGSATEYVFYNAVNHFNKWNGSTYNSFLRDKAHLVVIMITDEKEQSGELGQQYNVSSILNNLEQRVTSGATLRFYGALNFDDLTGCSGIDFNKDLYAGSPFEEIIEQTSGFVISACINDFGTQLARIGEDIANLIRVPRLTLKNLPVIKTIVVKYKGEVLKPGRLESGGVWYYDYNTNTINFYTVDFVEDLVNDHLEITFDVRDGVGRP